MINKIVEHKKHLKFYTSWAKILFVVLAGIIVGYFFLGNNLVGLDFNTIFDFIVLVLITCVLALLLDIRKMLIALS